MTTERARDRRNLDDIIDVLERRLDAREMQAAQLGSSTPPEIRIEIEDLRAQLRELRPGARTRIAEDVMQEIGPLGQYQLLFSHIQTLHADLYAAKRDTKELAAHLSREIELVETKLTAHLSRLQERFDRAMLALTVSIIIGFVALALISRV